MSEADQEWMEVLKSPSITMSVGSFLLGSWMAFLTLLNIISGAYSDGRKVNWMDFITNGPVTNSAHEIGLNFPDDLIFCNNQCSTNWHRSNGDRLLKR